MNVLSVTRRAAAATALGAALLLQGTAPSRADDPARVNDFPTLARVEFVQECMLRNGGAEQYLYKCVCVIDKLAESFSYDEFVEAQTFANYSGLAGERAGVFRDSDRARQLAKRYRDAEDAANKSCGIPKRLR